MYVRMCVCIFTCINWFVGRQYRRAGRFALYIENSLTNNDVCSSRRFLFLLSAVRIPLPVELESKVFLETRVCILVPVRRATRPRRAFVSLQSYESD